MNLKNIFYKMFEPSIYFVMGFYLKFDIILSLNSFYQPTSRNQVILTTFRMGIYFTSYVAKMHFYFFKCRQVKKVKDLYFQLGFLGMKYGNVINDPVRSNETT